MNELDNIKAIFVNAFREAIVGVAKSGAKATARAVDSVLEDVGDRADEFVERVKQGRTVAQKFGARPTKKVNVDARVVDAELEDT